MSRTPGCMDCSCLDFLCIKPEGEWIDDDSNALENKHHGAAFVIKDKPTVGRIPVTARFSKALSPGDFFEVKVENISDGCFIGIATGEAFGLTQKAEALKTLSKGPVTVHKEYKIKIKKKQGHELGIDVTVSNESLSIDFIEDAGLIGQWNEANPDSHVRVTDRIFEVNGKHDKPEDMYKELEAAGEFELTIRGTRREYIEVAPPRANVTKITNDSGQGEVRDFPLYTITLDRRNGNEFGIVWLYQGSTDTILIENIEREGLVSQWNSQGRGARVHPGDEIIEVNGIRNPHKMEEELLQHKVLEMTLRSTHEEKAQSSYVARTQTSDEEVRDSPVWRRLLDKLEGKSQNAETAAMDDEERRQDAWGRRYTFTELQDELRGKMTAQQIVDKWGQMRKVVYERREVERSGPTDYLGYKDGEAFERMRAGEEGLLEEEILRRRAEELLRDSRRGRRDVDNQIREVLSRRPVKDSHNVVVPSEGCFPCSAIVSHDSRTVKREENGVDVSPVSQQKVVHNRMPGGNVRGLFYGGSGDLSDGRNLVSKKYGDEVMKGDHIGVHYDVCKVMYPKRQDVVTLTFYLNGRCLGPAFVSNKVTLGSKVYPVVKGYCDGDRFSYRKVRRPPQLRHRESKVATFSPHYSVEGTWLLTKTFAEPRRDQARVPQTHPGHPSREVYGEGQSRAPASADVARGSPANEVKESQQLAYWPSLKVESIVAGQFNLYVTVFNTLIFEVQSKPAADLVPFNAFKVIGDHQIMPAMHGGESSPMLEDVEQRIAEWLKKCNRWQAKDRKLLIRGPSVDLEFEFEGPGHMAVEDTPLV